MLIIKKYLKKFHGHKLDNLRENTQFAKTHKEELNDLNRPISIKEIEIIIPNRKQLGSLVNSTKHLRDKLYKYFKISFRK